MKIYRYPDEPTLMRALERPQPAMKSLDDFIESVFDAIRTDGDEAVRTFSERFDGIRPDDLYVSDEEFEQAERMLDPKLKEAIAIAAQNIRTFHESQVDVSHFEASQVVASKVVTSQFVPSQADGLRKQNPVKIETTPGVVCWRKSVGLERVGLYIPGGTAPLFSSVLMLGIPARIAGCRDILLATPCSARGRLSATAGVSTTTGVSTTGAVHPAILFAASHIGLRKVLKVGGAQAIAAMAIGTGEIPKVDKIFGPGNAYVTAAKQRAQKEGVAIDMPAGPSELMVVADATANPVYVAADLLSQAEHGPDSQVLLVTDTEELVSAVHSEIERQLARLPRREIAETALSHSRCIIVAEQEFSRIINLYAPEHLILNTDDPEALAETVLHAGSVFLGPFTPESLGDYASGTNHTLPTHGYAKNYSGVSVDSFVRNITFQRATKEGLHALGPVVERMAEAEQLMGHKFAVSYRYDVGAVVDTGAEDDAGDENDPNEGDAS